MYARVVTKISSCRVNTTSRRGIKRLGISFGSIFLLFSNKSSWGHSLSSQGKSLARNDNPGMQQAAQIQTDFILYTISW